MKFYFLLFFSYLIMGCTEIPHTPTSKSNVAKKTIQNNKTEAQKAKEAYLELQKQRKTE